MASKKIPTIKTAPKKASVKEEPITEEQKEEREEVTKWLAKIESAKKVKDDWRGLFRVAMAYDYRDGKQRPSEIPEAEWFTINKIYSNLMAELPTLYSHDPYFYVKLEKSYSVNPLDIALYEQRAKIRTSMLNYLKRELKLKDKSRTSVLDAYFQFGVIKTHFQADMIDNPDAENPMLDDNENIMLDETTGAEIMQPEKLPVNEAYKITRVHPDDFLFDAEAGTLEDEWPAIYQRIKRPLDDAKEDEKYVESARKKIKATDITEDQVQKAREERKKGTAQRKDDPEATIAVLWECYDLKKKQWFVVSEGCNEYLIKPGELPKGTEGHPFGFLRLGLLRDDSPYPIPPVSQWLDPQKAYCEIRSKMMVHRKRFNRKYEAWEGAFSDPDSELGKLEIGGDGTVIRKQQPQQAIYAISDAPLDQNHYMELQMIRGDLEEVATGANQQGYGSGVDSATEASIIEKRVSLREGDRLSFVMDFVTDIARKLDQLVQGNITKDHAVKVDGPEGERWELVRQDDYKEIAGEFGYSVNTGASTPQIPEIERAQWMAFLQLIASAPQLAASKSLLKRTAEMFHIYDQVMIDEINKIARQMMGGGQEQGGVGSLPGVPDMITDARSKTGGAAAGVNNIRGGAQ